GKEWTLHGSPVNSGNAGADGAQHGRVRCQHRASRESSLPQAGSEGFEECAFGGAEPHFERIGGPALGARQELTITVCQPRGCARTATVDSKEASHRAFSHRRSALGPIFS